MKKFFLILLTSLLLVGCTPPDNPKPDPEPDPTPVDTGLTQEELIGALSLEDEFKGPHGHMLYFQGTDTVNWYMDATSFYRSGKISGFEYLKNNKYKVSFTIPAFPGNDETEAYDEYVYDLELVYDPANKRFLEVSSKDFSGSFVADPIKKMEDYYLEGSVYQLYPDHHFVGKVYGTSHESFGHSYYLDLERDGKVIDTALFAKGKEQHIYESTPASRFMVGRYYYCEVFCEQILAHKGGSWILVVDYKNNKIYSFEDVYSMFSVENGRYIMNIATEYEEIVSEGSSFIEPIFVQYEFTENGLVKLNS